MTNEPKQVIPEDGLVNAIGDESRAIVVGPPAAPLTYEDLLRVFEKECPAEMAAELAGRFDAVAAWGFLNK